MFLVVLGLFIAPFVHAEAPSGAFGFLDGKYYDESQSLKYICFQDNNCYDMNQKFAFKREVAGVTTEPVKATTSPITNISDFSFLNGMAFFNFALEPGYRTTVYLSGDQYFQSPKVMTGPINCGATPITVNHTFFGLGSYGTYYYKIAAQHYSQGTGVDSVDYCHSVIEGDNYKTDILNFKTGDFSK